MELKESLADLGKCLILNRLAYNSSKANVETWQSKTNALASTFERIIQYRSALLWSTIIYNSSIMESFDAALEALPRSFELDEYRLVYGWDSSVSKAASRLLYSALALFLRLAVFNKEIDNTLSQKEYLELIRGREAMPAKRLDFAFSFFMDHKQLMIEVARKQSCLDGRFCDQINGICANFDQVYLKLQ
ncbi:hypothetical protein KIN20_037036 [Parelaphostrongylus tenuis]|uniref:Uncharacterized protein n=1 Tax=Parelaphostrongylus tenuis TaxID=148309 RepID=A0AAD5WM48_PARTN|nr:hypothetical protein KIN20_037036 [Parelaphostrongylus tenuis]